MIKTVINTFWQSSIINGDNFLAPNRAINQRIRFQIDIFYFYILFLSISTFSPFNQFPKWDTILNSHHLFEPIWTLKWMSSIENWGLCVKLIFCFFLVSSVLGTLVWKRSKLSRTAIFFSFLLYLSLISSFGKIDHYLHLPLICSFILIFVPSSKSNNSIDYNLPKIFFGIQTIILLTYFSSGIFKIYGILDQELLGLKSALYPDSLAQNLSKTSFASNSECFLQSLILHSPSYFYSIVLVVGFLIEFLSIYVIFRPKVHRIWGLLLILLHAGILLSVGPDFTYQVLVIGIFILFSPFSSTENDLIDDIRVHFKKIKYKFSKNKNDFIIFYDGECLMCNRFLKFISKFDLPKEMRICKIQSSTFSQLIKEKPDLSEIDSIIVVETNADISKNIRIKASGITWVLSKINLKFWIIELLFKISPFLGNCIYDIIAKNRKKTDPNNCPITPKKIRSIILNE